LLFGATTFVHAAGPTACARVEAVRRTSLDAARCTHDAGVSATNTAIDAEVVVPALFARAEQQTAAADLAAAGRMLDCAESVLGNGDGAIEHHASSRYELARYELIRRRAILDYRSERIPQALAGFECALERATAREDRAAVARDLKNVGSALRRLGDFRGALQRLSESLAIQRAEGGTSLGPVLNNIGDVYRDLGESGTALRYYRDALQDFRTRGNPVEAAHVIETISVLEQDRGQPRVAAQLLESALQEYRQAGHRPYRLRIYAGLTRIAIAEGDLAKAEHWRAAGLAVADEYGLVVPAALQLQAARVDRYRGRHRAAQSRLRAALDKLSDHDNERADLLQELAVSLESEGDMPAAIAVLREAHAAESRLIKSKYDRQQGWTRSRFEAAEREHRIVALEADKKLRDAALRQRTLLLWSTIASALALLSLSAMYFLRRQQRQRIDEAARQARHDEELARYRQQAVALGVDRRLLQALFDEREDAVCVIDAEGTVLTANRAACDALAAVEDTIVGRDFAECLGEQHRDDFHAALVKMEDAARQRFDTHRLHDDKPVRLNLSEWERDGGLILLTVESAALSPNDAIAAEPVSAHSDSAVDADPGASQQAFRRALVELMLAVADAWERSTGQTRLELAEKSRIWRITIDDGRLRARAMERYLNLSKLPQNPRWRDVLRSAYFVLGQCALDPTTRTALQAGVDAVLAYTRRSALA
jgi:two-component system, sensor histidine kinase ChiS